MPENDREVQSAQRNPSRRGWFDEQRVLLTDGAIGARVRMYRLQQQVLLFDDHRRFLRRRLGRDR